MKTGRNYWPIFISLLLALAIFIQMLSQRDINGEIAGVSHEMDRLDQMILEDKKVSQILREHEARLNRLAENPEIYYLPAFIEGKELYMIMNDADLNNLSASLALKDLLVKYPATKGGFYSGDPQEWKKVLINSGLRAKGYVKDAEIPAIRKRIVEVDQETHKLQTERNKLFRRYEILRQRSSGA